MGMWAGPGHACLRTTPPGPQIRPYPAGLTIHLLVRLSRTVDRGCDGKCQDIDLSAANERLQARISAAVAGHESEHKAGQPRAKQGGRGASGAGGQVGRVLTDVSRAVTGA